MNYGLTLFAPPAAEPLSLARAKDHLYVDIDDHDETIAGQIIEARQHVEETLYRQLIPATWDLVLDRLPTGTQELLVPKAPLIAVTEIKYIDTAGVSQVWAAENYIVSTSREPGRIQPAYDKVWPTARRQPEAATVRFVCGYGNAFSADAIANTLAPTLQKYSAGDQVTLSNYGGALPGGLTAGKQYYVVNPTSTTIQLSATAGGAAIDLTSAGTGNHLIDDVPALLVRAMLLMIGHWFEHREEATELPLRQIPVGAERLLALHEPGDEFFEYGFPGK